MKSLKEIVEQLKSCGYTCEAGPLEDNVDFRLLEQIAGIGKPSIRAIGDATFRAMVEKQLPLFLKHAARTPQQKRDEIIEKAKRDVAELFGKVNNVAFSINRDKRTVVAYSQRKDHPIFARPKGIAKADPSDCLNSSIGKAIALRRALGLEVPAEYYTAPQPTEVRVGDVVYLKNAECNMDATSRNVDEMNRQRDKGIITIIDDSRK